MANASTRAHVAGTVGEATAIPVADPENHQISEISETDIAIEPTNILSRKERRKQKHNRHDSALPTPSASDSETSQPRKPPNNPAKQKRQRPTDSSSESIPRSMASKNAAQRAYPLLVCSIGNPGSTYANTLHSTGHILTSYIATRKAYLPFTKGLSGLVSHPDTSHLSFHSITQGFRRTQGSPVPIDEDWTLWQSTSLMNVSGKGVNRAYTEWMRGIRQQYGNEVEGRLVVVHDELETALGRVTIRDGAASAKGHNGLKSCAASLGKTKWWRVGVGIGRPESREPDDVARYVLRKVTERERRTIEDSAIDVVRALDDIAGGKR